MDRSLTYEQKMNRVEEIMHEVIRIEIKNKNSIGYLKIFC